MKVEGIIKLKKIKYKNGEVIGILYYPELRGNQWSSETIGFAMKLTEEKAHKLKKLLIKKELFEISGQLCRNEKSHYIRINKIELCKNKYENLGKEKEEENLDLTL